MSAWSLIVLNHFLTSSSIRTKLIIATAPCLLALLVFASIFGWGQIQKGREMSQVVQLANFTETVGNLVHELQKERGRTAGFVGSAGASAQASVYKQQQGQTDNALKVFREEAKHAGSLFHSAAQKSHFNQVSRYLEGFELDLPGRLGRVSAQTAWSNERESGVQFKEPLISNIMEQLLAMHKKSDAA